MTEIQYAAFVRATGGTSGRYVQSIDLTEYGALVVNSSGEVQMLPWHSVGDITFFNTPEQAEDADLPRGHEGSD